MRISPLGSLSFLLLLVWSLPALSQEPTPSSPQAPITEAGPAGQAAANLSSPPPASFNDVLDRIVQREHLFVAQMRHMRPMIETYLQDLRSDKDGNSSPVKDQYFLGRLDMSDGPEDTSFIGQPGFGHRMLNRLTGLYAMHFLPLGFAQMVVLDTDFQKKYYKFTFVRREFLGSFGAWSLMCNPARAKSQCDSWAGFGLKIRITTSFALTALIILSPR